MGKAIKILKIIKAPAKIKTEHAIIQTKLIRKAKECETLFFEKILLEKIFFIFYNHPFNYGGAKIAVSLIVGVRSGVSVCILYAVKKSRLWDKGHKT